jgi:hypothetical protein
MIMKKPKLAIGTKVTVNNRVGTVEAHSTTVRDRVTERALIGVKLYKGRYPLSYFKDTDVKIVAE